jgi:hypothetical protein
MHKVKQFWSQVIFQEEVDPESVYENQLSPTEVKDGYLNLSNMDVPGRCQRGEDQIQVVLINVYGDKEAPVAFRCHERKAKGKRGKIYKRQRFWPVGFGLKEWFRGQRLEAGDLIFMAVATEHDHLVFRAIRPKALLMLHDRRAAERRALERRYDSRRRTIVHVSAERRRKDRRRDERRAAERRHPRRAASAA